MKRIIGTLALAAALGATGALAESTVNEHRGKLAKLWGQESQTESAPVAAAVRKNFTGIGERSRDAELGAWGDNWRGGRKFPPAGH